MRAAPAQFHRVVSLYNKQPKQIQKSTSMPSHAAAGRTKSKGPSRNYVWLHIIYYSRNNENLIDIHTRTASPLHGMCTFCTARYRQITRSLCYK